MNAIWLIGKQSIQFLFKDRMSLIWFLIVPVAYIFIFGNAFTNAGGDPSSQKAWLSVLNEDQGIYSQRLMTYLKSENLQIDSLSGKPDNAPVRMLTLPDSFSTCLAAKKPIQLDLTIQGSADPQASMTVRMAVRKAYLRLLADIAQIKVSGRRVNEEAFQQIDNREPILTLKSEYAGYHQEIPRGFSQQIPAQIVQFTTLMLFIYAGHAILDEKRRGLLRRMKTTPLRFIDLFLGKLLFVLALGLTQSFLLLAIGHLIFGVYLGSSLMALMLILIVFILTVGTMGLCLGFLIKNQEKLSGIAILCGLLMSAISGCWWPLEISPPWIQKIALMLPTGMALKALHAIISFGKGFTDILPYLFGLFGIALLFATLLGIFLMRYQEG